MHDLTKGSIARNLIQTASFMLVGMVFQTLYFLVDLKFVGMLGPTAVAAVGLSGNLMFYVLALTQALGVGTTALIAHATGRKDPDQARFIFNQSQVLSIVVGPLFFVALVVLRGRFALAPALMFGWGTGHPLGVAGTAIASFVSVIVGVVWLIVYVIRKSGYLRFVVQEWRPR